MHVGKMKYMRCEIGLKEKDQIHFTLWFYCFLWFESMFKEMPLALPFLFLYTLFIH